MTITAGPVIYPVKDVEAAKGLFRALLGIEPSVDTAYYVHFTMPDREIGLLPNGHDQGLVGPIVYYDVADIESATQSLVDAGATVIVAARDVGAGLLVASVRDDDGNDIGLRQLPS
ncbi:MAG: VOC family protein [Acidimicrobiales bacterium]|jgi:predicted enzyme related to lactoylglutathione lyase